jgi:curved DNA-binding protein
LQRAGDNHYATLGLDRRCTAAQIRDAYRSLARQHHPDLNPDSPAAVRQTQRINAAYHILSDPARRQAYDREFDEPESPSAPKPAASANCNVTRDLNLRLEEFLRGTTREIRVNDPASPNGAEVYELVIPPNTSPGTQFRLPRAEPFTGGWVRLKARPLPDFRFKVRGSDLRCDLKISCQLAARGGTAQIRSLAGASLRVPIRPGVGRNEIIRLAGEGLPRRRGGCGDLLVRVVYRPEVRITRPSTRRQR